MLKILYPNPVFKAFQRGLSFIMMFLLLSSLAEAQIFKSIPNPRGRNVSNNIFNITRSGIGLIIREGSVPLTYIDTFGLYTLQNDQWQKKSSFVCHSDGNAAPAMLYKNDSSYYVLGYFDSIPGLPRGNTTILEFKNNSWSKVPIYDILPTHRLATISVPYILRGEPFASHHDTVYFPIYIYPDSSLTYRMLIVRKFPGGLDTLLNVTQPMYIVSTKYGVYARKIQNPGTVQYYKIVGNTLRTDNPPVTTTAYFTNINGLADTTDVPLMNIEPWPYLNLQEHPDSGKYLIVDPAAGPLVFQNNHWMQISADRCDNVLQVAYLNGDYYAMIRYDNYINKLVNGKWEKLAKQNTDLLYNYNNAIYAYNSGIGTIYKMSTNYGRIHGYAFLDSNSNCSQDSTEKGASKIMLEFTPGYKVSTDQNGYYSLYLDSGSYTASIKKKYYHAACSSSLQNKAVKKDSTIILNIPVSWQSAVHDLSVDLEYGRNPRRGFNNIYSIRIKNIGTVSSSYHIDLNYDQRLQNFTASDSFTRIDSNTVRFSMPAIGLNESRLINFWLTTDTVLQLGEGLLMDAYVYGSFTDSVPGDNRDTIRPKVVGAYDPNEKSVYPDAAAKAPVKELEYKICFQNMGSDSAVNIRVVDTLDQRLDMSSLDLKSMSHSGHAVIRGNVITWYFNDIMLPPAAVNEAASHGYVIFSASLGNTLGQNDSVLNRAFIYFDFEAAIITNKAVSKYAPQSSSIAEVAKTKASGTLKAYPNPASDQLFVLFESPGEHQLTLYDLQGRKINDHRRNGAGEMSIQTAYLPSGVYLLKDNNGNYARVVIAR